MIPPLRTAHAVRPGPARSLGGAGFALVGAVLVLLMFSSSAPSALYVLYQEKWDLSSGMITVVYGVYAVTVLAALLLFGALSDTLGRRPVLMVSLALAILCQFGLFRTFFRSDPGVRRRSMNIVVAGLSLTLWFSVGWAGRIIAFV